MRTRVVVSSLKKELRQVLGDDDDAAGAPGRRGGTGLGLRELRILHLRDLSIAEAEEYLYGVPHMSPGREKFC